MRADITPHSNGTFPAPSVFKENIPIVMDAPKITMCMVEKCGSSRFKLLLLRGMGYTPQELLSGHSPLKPHSAQLLTSPRTSEGYLQALTSPEYPRVIIVRSPYARLLSAFLNKVCRDPTPSPPRTNLQVLLIPLPPSPSEKLAPSPTNTPYLQPCILPPRPYCSPLPIPSTQHACFLCSPSPSMVAPTMGGEGEQRNQASWVQGMGRRSEASAEASTSHPPHPPSCFLSVGSQRPLSFATATAVALQSCLLSTPSYLSAWTAVDATRHGALILPPSFP